VLEVDVQQKRISLSMKKESQPKGDRQDGQKGGKPGQAQPQGKGQGKQPSKKPHATVDQLKDKFGGDANMKKNNMKLAFSVKSLMRSGR